MMRKIERENTGLLKPGQDLVVAGYAGLVGSVLLVKEKDQYERLRGWFSEEWLDQAGEMEISPEQDKIDWSEVGATDWESAGEGGILSAIWCLSGAYGTGVEFALRKIPVRQDTIEICERLELNPYRLYSQGCWLLSSKNGGRTVENLREKGIPAQVIGSVTKGIAREMIVENGHGFLERPQPDELEKIVPGYFKQEAPTPLSRGSSPGMSSDWKANDQKESMTDQEHKKDSEKKDKER